MCKGVKKLINVKSQNILLNFVIFRLILNNINGIIYVILEIINCNKTPTADFSILWKNKSYLIIGISISILIKNFIDLDDIIKKTKYPNNLISLIFVFLHEWILMTHR